MEQKKYPVSDAAPLIGVSESTLYSLVSQKKITHLRIGGKILFRQQDIDDFLNGCVVEKGEPKPAPPREKITLRHLEW